MRRHERAAVAPQKVVRRAPRRPRLLLASAIACALLALALRPATAKGTHAAHTPSGHGAKAKGDSTTAEADPAASSEPQDPEAKKWTIGPAKIDLGHDMSLALPSEYVYLPAADASKLLEKMGNFHNENLLGIVTSKDENADWFMTIRFEDEGYIGDDEKIDADELLTAIREGNEDANKERTEKGFKPLKIDGWSNPPQYDKSTHHLVWALEVSDDEGKSVNYNTRVLGRHGYASLNLVTDPDKLAQYKPHATALLGGTTFTNGSRYEDFDKKTDKVAEYGLGGLVLGGAGLAAAKLVKIGLIAKFWKVIVAVLIAGKKAIVLALAAIAAFFKKFFSGRKNEQKLASASQGSPPDSPPPG